MFECKIGEIRRKHSFPQQDSLHNWEDYESARQQMEEFVKKANNELSRSPANAGQEAVQKELATKREMNQVLQELQPTLDQMATLSNKLREKASPPRQDSLQQDLGDLQDQLTDTFQLMDAKVGACNLPSRYIVILSSCDRITKICHFRICFCLFRCQCDKPLTVVPWEG